MQYREGIGREVEASFREECLMIEFKCDVYQEKERLKYTDTVGVS